MDGNTMYYYLSAYSVDLHVVLSTLLFISAHHKHSVRSLIGGAFLLESSMVREDCLLSRIWTILGTVNVLCLWE